MSTLSAAIIFISLGISIGVLMGRQLYRKPRVRPTLEEIAAYLGDVTELAEYEATIRRNQRILQDGKRSHMPFPNQGQASRVSKMRLGKTDRRIL